MKKILIETTGAFMLMTRFGFVDAFRPSISRVCTETSQFTADQQIRVLEHEVHEDATDEGFAKFYFDHDKDTEAAIQNYNLSLQGVVEDSDDAAKAKEAEEAAKAKEAEEAAKAKTTTAKAKTPAAKS